MNQFNPALTDGEAVLEFIKSYCLVPEGALVGKPIELMPFQEKFILDVYDNPNVTRKAILSISRKNGKTALLACILLAHIIGPMRRLNSQVVSGAMSREQASVVFNLAVKILLLQPKFTGLFKYTNSGKKIVGIKSNVEFRALSADGTTAHGLSPVFAVLDEVGQVRGPLTPFIEAITTSQGAHDNPLLMAISTQAPSDADCLSLWIDDAIRSGDPHTVCHVYAADEHCSLEDKDQWRKANPALGLFRSEKDLSEQIKQAIRIPSLEASVRNLLLNQRVSLNSLWLAPTVWKSCSAPPELSVLQEASHVSLGLDLSMRNDLTAAVASAKDQDGVVHLLPYAFTPTVGIEAREMRDKAPYTAWVRQGYLIAVPGSVLDYEWVCNYLKKEFAEKGITITNVQFDRWRINEFKKACDETGFAVDAEFKEIGQGYKDISPRIEFFESLLLRARIAHGAHPVLNMCAANAIVVSDPSNNRKLDKTKSTQRIDVLQAAVMAAGAFMNVQKQAFDVAAFIG